MQRFKKFIYYKLVHAWRELQGGHPFGMFRTCLEGIFKGSSFHVRPEKCGGMSQFFRDTTDKFAVCFRLALTHMPSFKRKPVAGGGKQLTRGLAPSGIVNPLRGDCLAPVSRLESAMTDKFGNGTAIDRPKFAEKTDAAKLAEISEFHGITDIHSFNGFNSFYDFLRKTFFHTRYVLVTGKDTENVSMPVYNLSINKDESYVLPIGIVHNCRCTVVQVRKDKYPLSDETQAMNLGSQATAGKHQEMFMYNPGKKMTTFPAYNAYTRKACIECPYSGGSIKLAKVPDNELCQACRILRETSKGNAGKIRRMAKPLQGKKIVRNELPQPILISGASLREWTNQPHKHYFAKNSMLLDIERILTEAVYLGKVENHKEKELKKGVKLSHIFECEVAGDKSWIIAREYKWGEIILHSISDNFEEVVKGIKKG